MGHGVSDKHTRRHIGDQQKKLDVPDSFRAGDRRVMALLLPCPADRGGIQGGADRQIERGDHPHTGFCFSARRVYGKVAGRLCADRGGNAGYGYLIVWRTRCIR